MKKILEFAIYTLISLIAFTQTSCNIAKVAHDLQKPKLQKEEKINNWVSRKNLQANEVLAIKPEKFYSYFSQFEVGRNFPYIFKNDGTFISYGYANGNACYKAFPEILGNLKAINSITNFPENFIIKNAINSTGEEYLDTTYLSLPKLYKGFTDLNGNNLSFVKDSSIDYVVIFPFALYLGNTFQKHDLKKCINAIEQNKNAKIKVILVNFDKQQWWSKEWQEKINIII